MRLELRKYDPIVQRHVLYKGDQMTRSLNHKTRRALAPKTRFGRNVSFSMRHTTRTFKPNLQRVTVEIEW